MARIRNEKGTAPGRKAAATADRLTAMLVCIPTDTEGNFQCDSAFEELLVRVAEGVAAGFVWPLQPGSCSTSHWAPPTSPKEIAEHKASHHALMVQIDAEAQAKKLAEAAERRRSNTPSLMTDDELRGQLG
jgi:hypothetical protein